MKKQLDQLIEFHKEFQVPYRNSSVTVTRLELINLRNRLMKEEVNEWYKAALVNAPISERAKELADILYVVFVTIITEGLQDDIEHVFDLVHASNISKAGGGTRPDGKILKGPNYFPPNLKYLDK